MRPMYLLPLALLGCGGVDDPASAERAYLGLDLAIERAMNLGMAGFNEASSANIADQQAEGDVSGTMVVGGQVDQGTSPNKQLRLIVTLVDYADVVDLDQDGDADDVDFVYDTETNQPLALDLSLRDIPDGTFDGTFAGSAWVDGDLRGEVVFDLDIDGDLEEHPDVVGDLRRVDGTTAITGTVSSRYGVYAVDVER